MHILAFAFNSGTMRSVEAFYFWPREWSIENFIEVFKQDNLINGLMISVFRTVVGTAVGVALMAMAAYALTIKTLPGASILPFLYSLRCYLAEMILLFSANRVELRTHFGIYILKPI